MTTPSSFWVTSLFGHHTKRGLVELHYQDWSLQLDTQAARKIAADILEAAEAADQDQFIYDFFTGDLGLPEGETFKIFQRFRERRAQRIRQGAHHDERDADTQRSD